MWLMASAVNGAACRGWADEHGEIGNSQHLQHQRSLKS